MKTLRFFVMLSVLLPFWGFSQEEGYLYENFNKETLQTFPPYGWSQIDADGDGMPWQVSADGVDGTIAAVSSIWFFNVYHPDNWLVTPPLYVEKATDSLKYWVSSFEGRSNYLEIRVSTKDATLENFTAMIDSVKFDNSDPELDHYYKSVSLKDFVGDTVYIAFRHLYRADLPDIDNTLSIALDNVSGPKVVPFAKDLAIEEITMFDGVSMPCDISDQPITAVIRNMGEETISGFTINCQSQGRDEEDSLHFSDIITETIDQSLAPGEALTYTFKTPLPFSVYKNSSQSQVYIRAFLTTEEDGYRRNDTVVSGFQKQNSFELPMTTGFEQEDPEDLAAQGWYVSYRPENHMLAPFSIGLNPKFAHKGTNYLTCGIYPTMSGDPSNGSDVFAASRCVLFEKDEMYNIDLFYGFRKLPAEWPNQELRFKVIMGKDQRDLLNGTHQVLFDTVLKKTEELIMPDNAVYSLFSSAPFQVGETGSYYLGLVFYSDSLVRVSADSWMIFVDDFTLRRVTDQMPVDLALQAIELPYDCNLTDAEEVKFVVRNGSVVPVSDVAVAYKLDNGEWITDTIRETIESNGSYEYVFSQKADLSQYGKHKVEGKISHPQDSTLSNNTLVAVTNNSEVLDLPYVDDFEDYGTMKTFEDEWKVITQGYFSYMAAFDYSEDTAFAYNGIGFMADASDNEQYIGPDDWAISRCLNFKKGESYDISFAYRIEMESPNSTNLNAYILASYDTASKVEQVAKLADIKNVDYKILQYVFTPEEDMVGHFAFHSKGDIGAPIIMIDALKVGAPVNLGTESEKQAFFSLYPNPAREEINVSSARMMKRVEVYNLVGKKVASVSMHDDNFRLNVSSYTEGMYLMVVENMDGERSVRKFVVNR